MHERISQRRTCSSHKHNHTHTPFFFFCKGGSDRLMKRASYSCCISLCVVLAAAHLKCRRYCLFLPFVRHFFFIVTHTGTHTKKKKNYAHATHCHFHSFLLFRVSCSSFADEKFICWVFTTEQRPPRIFEALPVILWSVRRNVQWVLSFACRKESWKCVVKAKPKTHRQSLALEVYLGNILALEKTTRLGSFPSIVQVRARVPAFTTWQILQDHPTCQLDKIEVFSILLPRTTRQSLEAYTHFLSKAQVAEEKWWKLLLFIPLWRWSLKQVFLKRSLSTRQPAQFSPRLIHLKLVFCWARGR